MQLKTKALIIRANNRIGESDRFVTALTEQQGVVRASVRGAQKVASKKGAATSLLSYSELTLVEGKSQWIVTEGKTERVFFGLRDDMQKLALAQYFCELAGVLCPREEPASEELRLLLNALHLLSEGARDPLFLKTVVEQRLLSRAGYTPDLDSCRECGETDGGMFLKPLSGAVFCEKCGARQEGVIPIPSGAMRAWRWLLSAPSDKVFSFRLGEESLSPLALASERFLLTCLGRGFQTLDFYHSVS